MNVFGLIGYPLERSLSPTLHSAAMAYAGIQGEYRLFPIPELPAGEELLSHCVNQLRSGEISGLNVTIPHKQSVIRYLDDLTPPARAIGAVNTIFRDQNRAIGDNTDAPGFREDFLRVSGPKILTTDAGTHQYANALVLGAGGAARAVIYTLWSMGYYVLIAARRVEQANQLIADFKNYSSEIGNPSERLQAISNWGDPNFRFSDEGDLSRIQIIVNATSAGMYPDIETSAWPNGIPFPQNALIYDLVYKPVDTKFLISARAAGNLCASGLGMLVEQAALSFECWTKKSVPRSVLRQALEIDFGNTQNLENVKPEITDQI